MGRDVERSGFAKGEVVAEYLSPDRLDLACGTIGEDRRGADRAGFICRVVEQRLTVSAMCVSLR
jgi:hypothetical protein